MTLEFTQPPTEMSIRNLPGGEGRPARKDDNLTAICETIEEMWEPRRLTTSCPSTACYWDNIFLFLFVYILGPQSDGSGLRTENEGFLFWVLSPFCLLEIC
jgi:hypothetical protein